MPAEVRELDAFLDELGLRRQRLIQLAGPAGNHQSLVDELTELSEQLIVADEELRVQQEELDGARAQLEAMASERQQLLGTVAGAWVVTDENGVVVQSTLAAEQLIRQPASRTTPRPIATWFSVDDRSQVRAAIGQVRHGLQPVHLERVTLTRSDGSAVAVDVVITPLAATQVGKPQLRWEIVERPAGSGLRVVSETVPEHATTTADELADAVLEMAGTASTTEVAQAAVQSARTLVPGAVAASLAVRGHGRLHVVAVTDEGLAGHDLQQVEDWHRSDRAETQLVWQLPDYAVRSVRLRIGDRTYGVLSVMAAGVEDLDADAVAGLRVIGAAVVAALAASISAETLHDALRTRGVIGQAVGVLVERKRMSASEAFDRLTKQSQDHNVKLVDLARQIVETGRDAVDIERS